MRIVRKLQVKNPLGLHIRPAAAIVQLLQPLKSMVSFTYKLDTINARSIIGILTLAVQQDEKITVTVEGDDAAEVMERLAHAFANGFGEK